MSATSSSSYVSTTNYINVYNYYMSRNSNRYYVLSIGDTDAGNNGFVSVLQSHLKSLGLYTGSVDGIFGSGTKSAVLKLQNLTYYKGYSLAKLSADGIVGAYTWGKLENLYFGWYNKI
ncbi:peptidoglycan-binding protein [Clostridium tyrobutyricum]|nr:peptidoglycan-binding protein [Clostridium tyrobutyricum]